MTTPLRALPTTHAFAATLAVGIRIGAATRDVSTLRATNDVLERARYCAEVHAVVAPLDGAVRRTQADIERLDSIAGWMEARQPGPTVWLAHDESRGPEAGSP